MLMVTIVTGGITVYNINPIAVVNENSNKMLQ